MNTAVWLNFVNLILCATWGFLAAQRLAVMHGGVLFRLQIIYVAVFVASVFCGLQFFIFGTSAGRTDILYSFVLILCLSANARRWRKKPPAEAVHV